MPDPRAQRKVIDVMSDEPLSPQPAGPTMPPPPVGDLRITDAFGYGWRKFLESPGLWLLVALAAVLTGAATSGLAGAANSPAGGIISALLQFVLTNVVGYTLLVMALHAVNRRPVRLPDFPNEINLIATYLVGSFLYGIGVLVGLILLIVPGIMFAVAFYFYGLIIVDTGADPITAFREASRLSKGKRWPLLGAGLLATLITFLGLLAFGIGLLLAVPVNSVAAAHIYHQLRRRPIAD